jgi:hypothetical protein
MNKIPRTLEDLFVLAVSLDHTPTLSNSIYLSGRFMYILNFDNTLLVRVRLRDNEATFAPIGFYANDYDSANLEIIDDRVVFTKKSSCGQYVRKKFSNGTSVTPGEIRKLFNNLLTSVDMTKRVMVSLQKTVMELLDESLSHTEFTGKKGNPVTLTQRNVYSGDILTIREGGLGFLTPSVLHNSVEPLAIKTRDLGSLFILSTTLDLYFPKRKLTAPVFIRSDKGVREMLGFVSPCLYEEVIKLKEVK